MKLLEVVRSEETTVDSDTYTLPQSWPVTVKVTSSDEVTIWVNGTQEIVNTSGLAVAAGGVALASEQATFDNVKVGYTQFLVDTIASPVYIPPNREAIGP